MTWRGAALIALAIPCPVSAQLATADTAQSAAFVAAVREATARFRDREQAVIAGYRPIGPDFPGMGEHWISVPLLLEGRLDPARPPILEYAEIGGVMTLTGAAFAVLVPAGGAPPTEGIPAGANPWHYHGGTVDEESFVLGHAHGAPARSDQPRMAVLHVWAWLDNPDGPFATDNWALPFARLGLPRPVVAPSREVAHALALAAGGARYYLAVVAAGTSLDSAGRVAVAARLADSTEEIRTLLRKLPLDEALPRAGAGWQALRREVVGLP